MNKVFIFVIRGLLILTIVGFNSYRVYAEESASILKQMKTLQKDIKTLEKAVYSQSTTRTSGTGDL